ncbi:MAG: hypothetical protein WCI43_06910 [Candidatus Firestonebacteria bacterium]
MPNYHELSDEELVQLINEKNDKRAYTEIIIRYRKNTQLHVIKHWGNVVPFRDAEDFAHDIIIEMKEKFFDRYDPDKAKFNTYYWLKVKSKLLTLHEQKTKAKANEQREKENKPRIAVPDVVRLPGSDFQQTEIGPMDESPESALLLHRSILARQITEAVSEVPNDSYRRAFLLKLLYSGTNTYLGELLGIPESTFKSNVNRAGLMVLRSIKDYYDYDAIEVVGETLDALNGRILDRKDMLSNIKNAKAKQIFSAIPDFTTIGDLCGKFKIKEKEVIPMMQNGLDDIAPGKKPTGPGGGLPDSKKEAAIERGLEAAASGKKRAKRKARSGGAEAEELKYEDFGRFAFSIFNDPPKKVKEKSLIEVYENSMKDSKMSDKEVCAKLGVASVSKLTKMLLGKEKAEPEFYEKLEKHVIKESGAVYDAIGVKPEKIDPANARRRRSAEINDEAQKVLRIIKDSKGL